MRFQKRSVIIDAVRLQRTTVIETLEGVLTGNPGDWLITGVAGEKYPCRHDIFCVTYEPADADAAAYLEQEIEAQGS
jgi:hypothetical protein